MTGGASSLGPPVGVVGVAQEFSITNADKIHLGKKRIIPNF